MGVDHATFRRRYGPWALVAGASRGIGAAFARQLAARGLDLVLVARGRQALDDLAGEVAGEHGVSALAVAADLGAPDVLERLRGAVADREVGLLVYNAAHSFVGSFVEQPLADKLRTVEVNCRGPLLLAHECGAAMTRRGRGGMIFMSSLAGMQGHRMVASYAATKAFDLVLGEALWDELRDRGVDVLSVCAGMTRTPGFEASSPRLPGLRARLVMEADEVAAASLAALGRQPSLTPGLANRLTTLVTRRLLSRKQASKFLGWMMRAIYSDRWV